jgi:hypothetical protein
MEWGKWYWISFSATSDDQTWNEEPKDTFDEEKRGEEQTSDFTIFGKAFTDEE